MKKQMIIYKFNCIFLYFFIFFIFKNNKIECNIMLYQITRSYKNSEKFDDADFYDTFEEAKSKFDLFYNTMIDHVICDGWKIPNIYKDELNDNVYCNKCMNCSVIIENEDNGVNKRLLYFYNKDYSMLLERVYSTGIELFEF